MEQELEVQGFDYSVVKPEHREKLRGLAVEGRKRVRRTKEELLALRDVLWEARPLTPHGYWETWLQDELGMSQPHAYQIMHPKVELSEIINNYDLPQIADPEPVHSPQDDEKDRKLAELEEKMRITNERLFSVESRATYYKEQATIAQAQAAHPPQVIEKRVEVTPQYVIERGRELQAQKTQLQIQLEQIKKERDLYKRDLDKERQNGNAAFLQGLESNGTTRLRANFAEVMREIVAWSRASTMKLPSVVDAQSFEAEEWQRLEEAIQANEALGQALRRVKHTPSSMQQSFIIDTDLVAG